VNPPFATTRLSARDYDLAATLACGQAFRWRETTSGWEGVIGGRWVRLRSDSDVIIAETSAPPADWRWLTDYLQTKLDLAAVLATFPDDAPLRASAAACRGLRLLRQEPWECLASFILSSTKQIVQIQQIVELLCERFGEPVEAPSDSVLRHAFPSAENIAATTEAKLRDCKMGFRAPSLLAAARAVDSGKLDLEALRHLSVEEAREQLTSLRGVGPKIANCVLLFAYGFQQAFPVDVWVMKASETPAATGAAAAFRGDLLRPERRLRAAVSVSLHANATHRGCGIDTGPAQGVALRQRFQAHEQTST
jgi:N-glycosylase/DNA lyase